MGIEIERKFLVAGDGWRAAARAVVPSSKAAISGMWVDTSSCTTAGRGKAVSLPNTATELEKKNSAGAWPARVCARQASSR